MEHPENTGSKDLKKRLAEMGIDAREVREPTKHEPVKVGDRLELYGGYDYDPRYLHNPKAQFKRGTVVGFVPSGKDVDNVVLKLDTAIVGDSIAGDVVVLSVRWVGQDWSMDGPVHIELCDFTPEPKPWEKRRQGEWIEAAASYRVLPSE